jgi:hypothetical protein
VRAKRPGTDPALLERRRAAMDVALSDACVSGYAPLIAHLTLPDSDDRHVEPAGADARLLAGSLRAGPISPAPAAVNGCVRALAVVLQLPSQATTRRYCADPLRRA